MDGRQDVGRGGEKGALDGLGVGWGRATLGLGLGAGGGAGGAGAAGEAAVLVSHHVLLHRLLVGKGARAEVAAVHPARVVLNLV